ncbi:hypothetical protein ARAF_0418 [Arsenophonus endosymbiont of Aleurodicus floccissimus]|uniref:hypothetical protein n=1 Tax=Arsenophonus endosymbiont of Aleurodicus floccissimus TaxID=2152761 RepID=UPI000E6B0AEA|nr:hypothetical protein [Arsenophonus endosymbiont of Aleurodicus floccissimus]SPP31299.1 hypothetical protein ARAF_0418 [Arsenophonus endosymbiont of Aleurodicus floccissimus]
MKTMCKILTIISLSGYHLLSIATEPTRGPYESDKRYETEETKVYVGCQLEEQPTRHLKYEPLKLPPK